MSSKTHVFPVPDFGIADSQSMPIAAHNDGENFVGDASAGDAATSETSAVPTAAGDANPTDDMSDGVIPPQESPEDPEDEGSPDVAINLGTLEALLMSTHHPLTPARLNELLEAGSIKAIRSAVQALNESYEQTGRSFRIEQVAGGYQILTLPEHSEALRRLHQKEADAKLTKAALETLSIIAYKQPILRVDVEAIRGVACGETIRSLMEKHLVKIAGRAEEPGRPILYGTTKRFLELFGLNSLKDLPKPEEFKPQGS